MQVQAEDQRQRRTRHEGRQRDRERRQCRERVVGATAARERRGDAGRNADEHRQQDRGETQRGAQRQSLADELADGEIPLAQRGPEVAVRQRAEVAPVLHGERPVEPVDAVEIGAYRRSECLLLIERTPGGEALQSE